MGYEFISLYAPKELKLPAEIKPCTPHRWGYSDNVHWFSYVWEYNDPELTPDDTKEFISTYVPSFYDAEFWRQWGDELAESQIGNRALSQIFHGEY